MPKIILGEKLFSTAEVAEMLGVSRAAVSSYYKRGLKSQIIGKFRYVTESNLRIFLNENNEVKSKRATKE